MGTRVLRPNEVSGKNWEPGEADDLFLDKMIEWVNIQLNKPKCFPICLHLRDVAKVLEFSEDNVYLRKMWLEKFIPALRQMGWEVESMQEDAKWPATPYIGIGK